MTPTIASGGIFPPVTPTADPVNAMLDELIEQVEAHFKAFVLARTCHGFGSSMLDKLSRGTLVSATVGLNMQIEPIPIAELLTFNKVYPDFVTDVFHGKLVQHWQDLLGRVFAHYVDLHLSGKRNCPELGQRGSRIDFRRQETPIEQVREALCRDFAFDQYSERQKLIVKLRDPAGTNKQEADTILQHVHIRNAIQHHHGILPDFTFKELGRADLRLLDEDGNEQPYRAGDKVSIKVPELNRFRRALLVTAQGWKTT